MSQCAVQGCHRTKTPVGIMFDEENGADLVEVCVDHGMELAPQAAGIIERETRPGSLSSGVGVRVTARGWRLVCPDLRTARLILVPPGVPIEEPRLR